VDVILAVPHAAEAQPAGKVSRIGILATANPRSVSLWIAFEQRLRELGYVEGQNIAIEFRNAEGKVDRLPGLAAELARLNVDVIVTATDLGTRAAKGATTKIPIVMAAINYEPIALGYIASLARPGGNITGIFFRHLELASKRLELFKEMLPGVSRVAVLADPETADQLKEVQAANRSLGLKLQVQDLRNPPYDIKNTFLVVMRSRPQALFVLESASIFRARSQIAQLALTNRLPTSFAFREYVEAGGLSAYGVNLVDMFRRAAEYTDRILRGADPGGLPVEQPAKFELVINFKTAKALGLTVPQSVLMRTDHVIE
jgi:putative tryptophan/tyrosine transport system substrate-binding protein